MTSIDAIQLIVVVTIQIILKMIQGEIKVTTSQSLEKDLTNQKFHNLVNKKRQDKTE